MYTIMHVKIVKYFAYIFVYYKEDVMREVVMNQKTNLLQLEEHFYQLVDVEEPNVFHNLFPYDEIPKIAFNDRIVPHNMPENIWITDTTFRDGQQSRAPYTTEQIVTIYDYLHKLGGPKGLIRQSEFFLYSKKDRDAVYKCLERGYKFPEVTSWIRASKQDFQLVKDIGLRETGILVSCSDYHIFYKMKMTRREVMNLYLSVIRECLETGISPRCHLEDITRSDIYGFVIPFCVELMKLMDEYKIPIKIRACDTMGYGVNFPGAVIPRSVPGIIYGLTTHAGVPSELIEWHGHNDFYKAVNNSTTAWLYGASGVNCSLFGIGERTGNTPLEAMVFEYAQLKGTLDGMDTTVITELAEDFEKEGYEVYSIQDGFRAYLRLKLRTVMRQEDLKEQCCADVERSIVKKFRKEIWRPFTKAINEYELIKDGDKIAVCISGGKDSMLMAKLFQELKRHGQQNFEVVYLVMNPGYNPFNYQVILDNAQFLNVPITVFESEIFDIVASEEQSPCYLCARMRRGYLYSKAKELGCNKIALGHHFDDVIETILMGMLYGAQIQTMMPKLHSTNFEGMELTSSTRMISPRCL